jgi:alkylation response protein AidB-like acyl-CoA dehydrogenase
MNTTAEPAGDYYIINGRKVMITQAPVCDIALVVAKTGDKYNTFLVDKSIHGFDNSRREDFIGQRGLPSGDIAFTDCRVPKANIIGQEGKGLAAFLGGISAMGRTGIAGQALGLAQGCYETALKYARERKLYGKPISELQAIQYLLVDSNVEIEAARLLCYKAASMLDQGKSPKDTSDDASRCKLYTCNIACQVALRSMQILGGYGTVPQYEIIRRLHDSIQLLAATGTQEIMKNMLARSIIS